MCPFFPHESSGKRTGIPPIDLDRTRLSVIRKPALHLQLHSSQCCSWPDRRKGRLLIVFTHRGRTKEDGIVTVVMLPAA